MTIIAASKAERVMLADTLVVDEQAASRLCYVVKIVRCRDGSIAGASGDAGQTSALLRWAVGGRRGRMPSFPGATDLEMMILTPDADILVSWNAVPERVIGDVHFIGAGADFAMAAHLAVASLERAVEIAIELSPKCGGTITRLELEPQRKRRVRR